ncbi:unnamed protein product [Lampetra fluviatilis]
MDDKKQEESTGGCKEFIWNPRTRQFMGRTGTSWALILLFYLVFYGFLAGLFSLTMWVLLQTTNEFRPKYLDRVPSPGLMIRPQADTLDIKFKPTQNSSFLQYVTALNDFLLPYNEGNQTARNLNCTPGRYHFQNDTDEVRNYPKTSCRFLRASLGECSGLVDLSYGYSSGTPCVILKMNRIISYYPNDNAEPLRVNCTGKRHRINKDEWRDDTEKVGPLRYFPVNGTFDPMYFPYYGKKAHVNYTQPVVAVRFMNATRGEELSVECSIAGVKHDSDRDRFLGRVTFRVFIQ